MDAMITDCDHADPEELENILNLMNIFLDRLDQTREHVDGINERLGGLQRLAADVVCGIKDQMAQRAIAQPVHVDVPLGKKHS